MATANRIDGIGGGSRGISTGVGKAVKKLNARGVAATTTSKGKVAGLTPSGPKKISGSNRDIASGRTQQSGQPKSGTSKARRVSNNITQSSTMNRPFTKSESNAKFEKRVKASDALAKKVETGKRVIPNPFEPNKVPVKKSGK